MIKKWNFIRSLIYLFYCIRIVTDGGAGFWILPKFKLEWFNEGFGAGLLFGCRVISNGCELRENAWGGHLQLMDG